MSGELDEAITLKVFSCPPVRSRRVLGTSRLISSRIVSPGFRRAACPNQLRRRCSRRAGKIGSYRRWQRAALGTQSRRLHLSTRHNPSLSNTSSPPKYKFVLFSGQDTPEAHPASNIFAPTRAALKQKCCMCAEAYNLTKCCA